MKLPYIFHLLFPTKHKLTKKRDITNWLDRHGVRGYTLVPDAEHGFVVDVARSVYLARKNLTCIPVQFNVVEGDFDCQDNLLKNLLGSPRKVNGHFWCAGKSLISFKGCPEFVAATFICFGSSVASIDAIPQYVGQELHFFGNYLLDILGDKLYTGKLSDVQKILDVDRIKEERHKLSYTSTAKIGKVNKL